MLTAELQCTKPREDATESAATVADMTPRMELDNNYLEKLHELSRVVMEHLDLIHSQQRLYRSQFVIEELCRFVDGRAV